jgi:uncharacterized protein
MLGLIVLLSSAFAAWPDSYPQRIAALDAFRFQFATPEIPADEIEIHQKYLIACELGFSLACKADRWSPKVEVPLEKAVEIFGPQCRSTQSPLACILLAFQEGMVNGEFSNQAPNPKRALALLTQSCEEKLYAPACSYLGMMYLNGVGTTSDSERGFGYLEEGCTAKDPWGCYQMGLFYGIKKEREKSESYLKLSCSEGVKQSCIVYAQSMSTHAQTDEEWSSIAPYLSQSCKWGEQDDCFILAEMKMKGLGVARAPIVGLTLYQSACASGLPLGCRGAAKYYEQNDDLKSASIRYDAACQLGDATSCADYGLLLLRGSLGSAAIEEGISILKNACSNGAPTGCLALSRAHAEGIGVSKDEDKALEYATTACEANMGAGCTRLAEIQMSLSVWGQGDVSELYTRACDLGDGRGCAAIALKKLGSEPLSYEILKAIEMGCFQDDTESCRVLGTSLLHGVGVAIKDEERGLDALEKSCFGGEDQACIEGGAYLIAKGGKDITQAANFFSEGCHRGNAEACEHLAPIAFSADFFELTRYAFDSNLCQVWSIDDNNPDENHLLGKVSGAQFTTYVGSHRNLDLISIHDGNTIDNTTKEFMGASKWVVSGQNSDSAEAHPWGESVQPLAETDNDVPIWGSTVSSIWESASDWTWSLIHEEHWPTNTKGSFRTEKGSQAQMKSDIGILTYDRDSELLRVLSGCPFTVPREKLYTEHCSEIQALITGALLMKCPQ